MPGFGVYLCLFNVVLHHASEMPLVRGLPVMGSQRGHCRNGHVLLCFSKTLQRKTQTSASSELIPDV